MVDSIFPACTLLIIHKISLGATNKQAATTDEIKNVEAAELGAPTTQDEITPNPQQEIASDVTMPVTSSEKIAHGSQEATNDAQAENTSALVTDEKDFKEEESVNSSLDATKQEGDEQEKTSFIEDGSDTPTINK